MADADDGDAGADARAGPDGDVRDGGVEDEDVAVEEGLRGDVHPEAVFHADGGEDVGEGARCRLVVGGWGGGWVVCWGDDAIVRLVSMACSWEGGRGGLFVWG